MFLEAVVSLIGKTQSTLTEICDVDGRIVFVCGDVAAEERSSTTPLKMSKGLDEGVLIGDGKSSLKVGSYRRDSKGFDPALIHEVSVEVSDLRSAAAIRAVGLLDDGANSLFGEIAEGVEGAISSPIGRYL